MKLPSSSTSPCVRFELRGPLNLVQEFSTWLRRKAIWPSAMSSRQWEPGEWLLAGYILPSDAEAVGAWLAEHAPPQPESDPDALQRDRALWWEKHPDREPRRWYTRSERTPNPAAGPWMKLALPHIFKGFSFPTPWTEDPRRFQRDYTSVPALEVPLSDLDVLRLHLAGWANQMAARFGFPVYLVGSSLTSPDPRDIDVRVVLSDDAFQARYGVLPQHADRDSWGQWGAGSKRWGEDMAKISRQAAEALHRNIDFQVQAELIARHRGFDKRPRVRLDTLNLTEITP